MMEIWKGIDGYPNYEISTFGRVRSIERDYVDSLGRLYHYSSRLIKIETQIGKKDNYKQLMVSISDENNKRHRLIVARLVAKAFIPNPDNLPQINHKDEDSSNNCVNNLEWCTSQYNLRYNDGHKRRGRSKSLSVKVFDKSGHLIDILKSCKDASEKYHVSRSSISMCCNGKIDDVKNLKFLFC